MGVCHNDIKLDNIFIEKKFYKSNPLSQHNDPISEDIPIVLNSQYRFVLGDFGMATLCSDEHDLQSYQTIFKNRNLLYQSPEVHYLSEGKSNRLFDMKKADIYALGMTLYVLAFGQFPKKLPSPSPRDPIYRYIIKKDLDSFYNKTKDYRNDLESQLGGYNNAKKFVHLLMKMMDQDPNTRIELNQVIAEIADISLSASQLNLNNN